METINRIRHAGAGPGRRQRFGYRGGLTLAVVVGGAAAACGSAVAPTSTAATTQSTFRVRPSGPYAVDLQAHVRGSCQTGDDAGSWPVVGHVSVVRDATGTVSADVTMDHGRPNQSYQVELVQTPDSIPYSPVSCGQPATVFATDGNGHSTARIAAPAVRGATGAFVHVLGSDPTLDVVGTLDVRPA